MATYEYQALTGSGRLMTGTLEAASHQQVAAMLAEMRLSVNEITKAKVRRPRTRIGRTEFLLFNEQLASLTKAGIPLERGLRELSRDVESKSMRRIILAIAEDLESGMAVEEAFEKRKKTFPPLYGQIIKAGVQTGRLSEMLSSLNRHMEMGGQTRRILFEATCYPMVVFAMAAAIMTLVFRFLVPQFVQIYAEMGGDLPLITRWIFQVAEVIVPFWIVIAGIVALIVVLALILSSFPAGRRIKESLLLGVPVMGRVYHRSILSRLADSMAMQIAAGSDLPTCIRLGGGASGSELLLQECESLAGLIEQGENLIEAGQFCGVIPPLFLYSVQLGSQRNELEDNLYSLADMYVQQVQTQQARLQTLLLPVMVVLVGGFVGLAVLGLFMPIVSLMTSVSG